MWQKVFQYFLRRFQITRGRSPMTPAEMNQIQSEAVNWINKTGGKTLPGTSQSQKPPFQGFTPRVIEGGKGKAGIGTLLKDSPEAIAKIKADNKAAAERLRNKKKTVEGFSAEGDWDPSGMASGGIARVGMVAGGPIVKGAAWVIKNLKKSVKEVDQGKGSFSKLNSMQQGLLKKELNTLIKQLEQGGTIPNEMLDTMIADPKFKSVVKTRSTDKDLYELEDVLLDRQAGKQAEQIVDDVFGKGHTENQQIDMLEKFDVTGRKKNASGGIAGPLHLYDGGRIGLKDGKKPKFPMSRRTFIGGILSALAYPFVRGFGKQATTKTAAPVVKEVIERGADGIPSYAWDLINIVKAKGTKEIMEGVSKRFPPQKKYTYKGVEVTEDGLGTTSVRKQHEGIGYDEAGEGFEGINKEVGFEIRTGEDIVKQGGVGDDAGKVIKADDEYFEATVRPDSEGKMKDVLEGIDDADHLDLKRIADESLIKKAEGGRVSLSKGGLAHVLGV
jgi:hypothetical protein